MASTVERLLDGNPPAWLRKVEARVICRVFASALDMRAPSLRTLTAGEALLELQEFTARSMQDALASGRGATCRQRLGSRALRLGTLVRRVTPLGRDNRQRLVRYLYRGIDIELRGDMPGELRFGPCSFARAYTPACCALMSAFDEGFICGMLGLEGPLTFSCRLTEGAACCRARVR